MRFTQVSNSRASIFPRFRCFPTQTKKVKLILIKNRKRIADLNAAASLLIALSKQASYNPEFDS